MTLSLSAYQTVKKEHDKAVNLEREMAIYWAESVAFYAAMLKAAEESPLDDPEDQDEMVKHLKTLFESSLESYMTETNW